MKFPLIYVTVYNCMVTRPINKSQMKLKVINQSTVFSKPDI